MYPFSLKFLEILQLMENTLILTGNDLDFKQVKSILRYKNTKVELSEKAIESVKISRKRIEQIINQNKVVYGVTTGFGKFSETIIPKESIEELQTNLIRSHACGMGKVIIDEVVKLAMVLRVNSLAKGYSGIRLETLETMIALINNNITPVVPCQGSLGASGDLAPLAHIALVLMGEGYVWDGDKAVESKILLERYNIKPIQLYGKEGLALINGTQITLAILLDALIKTEVIFKTADIAALMTLEACKGTPDPFDPDIHKLRPHEGQINTAVNIRKLMEGSKLILSEAQGGRVQDAYSLRCVPQVHGASRDAYYYAKKIAETEMNSVTDNPLIFPPNDENASEYDSKVLSGGNFHAQHLGIAADSLKVAIAEIGSISEARIERMLNPSLTDLTPFLTNRPGIESGFMIAQYTAAAILSENKALSHPATVDSIPVSGEQEDHCSMAPIAARMALQIADNVEKILAIELMIATQSIDLRGVDKASITSKIVHEIIRKVVKKLDGDRILSNDMSEIKYLIENDIIVDAIEEQMGELIT